ncbi:MAG: hypothetical protein HN353_12660 [Bdellovibrionales bacterium]|jgi:hypothetical protein|nr:hypothetical protein [Bdellovibrionales bacterium]MBT3526369.1 hypothetical protein [Bdellovibrionales bacterium]
MSAMFSAMLILMSLFGVGTYLFSTNRRHRIAGALSLGLALTGISIHLGYIYLALVEFLTIISIFTICFFLNGQHSIVDQESQYGTKLGITSGLLLLGYILVQKGHLYISFDKEISIHRDLITIFEQISSTYFISMLTLMVFGLVTMTTLLFLLSRYAPSASKVSKL